MSISLQQGETRYSLVLTNDLLRQLCGPIFQKVRAVITRAMKDRGRGGRLNDVILVGGSAQLTVFGDFLEELFGRGPHVAASPDEIVALGVGLRFEIYQGESYFASENLKLGEVEVQVPPG